MGRTQWRMILVVTLRVIITLLFIPAILIKLQHPIRWAQIFVAWGYPGWGALVVTIAEIIALIALWNSNLALTASAVLMITLTGATGTWLIHGPRATALYPGTIL